MGHLPPISGTILSDFASVMDFLRAVVYTDFVCLQRFIPYDGQASAKTIFGFLDRRCKLCFEGVPNWPGDFNCKLCGWPRCRLFNYSAESLKSNRDRRFFWH